jgi:hypothetical protein
VPILLAFLDIQPVPRNPKNPLFFNQSVVKFVVKIGLKSTA